MGTKEQTSPMVLRVDQWSNRRKNQRRSDLPIRKGIGGKDGNRYCKGERSKMVCRKSLDGSRRRGRSWFGTGFGPGIRLRQFLLRTAPGAFAFSLDWFSA